jgi:hypothetical protein
MHLIHRVSNSQRWLAPELCRDNGMLTTQSDIFAYGMTMLEVRWNFTWNQVASLTASFRSWPITFRGTPFATRRTLSSNFLKEKCLHVPKILRPPKEVWMIIFGGWFRSAGHPTLGKDPRRKMSLRCLDKDIHDVSLHLHCCLRFWYLAFELYISLCSLCYMYTLYTCCGNVMSITLPPFNTMDGSPTLIPQ